MSDDEDLTCATPHTNEISFEDDEEEYDGDDGYNDPGEPAVAKPTKDEIKVAKWMKKNVKTKKTKFVSHNVEYFTSNKAIDALMKSKFAEGDTALFTSREQAVEFLDIMLDHKFFHRAKKVPVTIEELRGSNGGNGGGGGATKSSSSSGKTKDDKKDEKSSKKSSNDNSENADKKDTEAEAEQSVAGGGNGGDESAGGDKKEQKRKRKIRLDMHPEQIFVDGSEAYVWIYDPIPIHYWIYGLILLLGAIGICMFPLWPSMLRKGVYYLSLAAAGFLVFMLALAVVRLIIFTIVWALTGGKLNFWIFPNLTEDVGFFASFWPLYESNYVSDEEKSKANKKSKSKSQKNKKDKDSDGEDDTATEVSPLEPEKIEEIKEHDADTLLRRRPNKENDQSQHNDDSKDEESNSSEAAAESDAKGSRTPSESESEISGKDYEIINSSEVQNVN